MKLNTLMSIFSPKDVKFFPLFKDTATILVQASSLLQELFALETKERRKELCTLIKAEEVKGDNVTGYIMKALNATFITPFDREDINELADQLDDIIDGINRTSQKVLLYIPESFPESTKQLTDIINRGAIEMQQAMDELPNLKHGNQQIRKHYKEIKRLEEEADVVYEHGITELFLYEKNTIELIKLKEIIQELEKTANKINSAGKVLKTIFVKYA